MYSNRINNRKYLKERRKELRNNLTPAEAILWTLLKNRQLMGRKFRRQQSIEDYIVDFYCPSEKLIIELDGEVHNNSFAANYDFNRDNRLKKLGYRVLRFENKEIFENQDAVLAEITGCFNHPLPPPERRGA